MTHKEIDKEILIRFGERVRQLRLDLGLSQEELANNAGLHRTYIGMIERAEKNITIVNASKIAISLNTTLSNLLRFEK
jgi:transcriptional regulator with XRE-family HTH domain